jgi:hypothetical protein
VALILSWAIAQACLLIPSLDAISALVSGFYILVYFFINVSCFAMKISGAPNFRPRFKYFSWHTALLGATMAIALAFATSAIKTGIAVMIWFGLCGYVFLMGPVVPWGDVSQALIYHQVRKYLLKLDERRAHPKFWRPAILLVVESPRRALKLIDFCNNMKKGGLYVIGQVVPHAEAPRVGADGDDTGDDGGDGAGDTADGEQKHGGGSGRGRKQGMLQMVRRAVPGDAIAELRRLYLELIDRLGIKAFNEIVVAGTARGGYQNLALLSGMGGMKANTVVIQHPEWDVSDEVEAAEDKAADDAAREGTAVSDEGDEEEEAGSVGADGKTSKKTAKKTKKVSKTHSKKNMQKRALRERADTVLGRMDRTLESMTGEMRRIVAASSEGTLDEEAEGLGSGGETDIRRGSRGASFSSRSLSYLEESASQNAGGISSDVMIRDPAELVDIVQDMMSLRKNVLLARHFHRLNKDLVITFHKNAKARRKKFAYNQSRMTVDIWTFARGEADTPSSKDSWDAATKDWSDLRGTLALQLQLAYTLHRVDVWWANTALRLVAVVPTTDRSVHAQCEAKLNVLLESLRIDADVVVLSARDAWVEGSGQGGSVCEEIATVLNSPPASPMLDRLSAAGPGVQMHARLSAESKDAAGAGAGAGVAGGAGEGEGGGTGREGRSVRADGGMLQHYHMGPLNLLIRQNCSNCCMIFMPLPTKMLKMGLAPKTFIQQVDQLTNDLPPTMLVAPGEGVSVVSTDI